MNIAKRFSIGERIGSVIYPICSVVLALIIGAVFITAMGFDWRFAYENLISGAVGSKNAIAETLLKTTPLIFTGLSFAIGKRCGLINLGADGQLYLGGLFSAIVGVSLSGLPLAIHLPLALIAGAIGGGALGLLTGWLKNQFGASELITGIMFNYVAIQLVSYFVTGPLKESGGNVPQSDPIADGAQLPVVLSGTRLHAGFLLAVLGIAFYYVFLWKTSKGFSLRITGMNPGAAQYAGLNIKRNSLLEFATDLGFDGIAVSLLGNNNPIGIFLSALLFGAMKNGSNRMQMAAQVPVSVIQVIQALVILFVVGRALFEAAQKLLQKKQDAVAQEGG